MLGGTCGLVGVRAHQAAAVSAELYLDIHDCGLWANQARSNKSNKSLHL